MAKNKKILIIGGIVLLFIVIIVSVVNYYTSRVYWKYDDKWIMGRTKEEVMERYGEFDLIYHEEYSYFLYKDNGFFGSGLDIYYCIIFDDNEIAIKIYVARQPGG
jgi:hypothetical protein